LHAFFKHLNNIKWKACIFSFLFFSFSRDILKILITQNWI
jgi:hypothetical protein